MIITPITDFILDSYHASIDRDVKRSEGCHVSKIIHAIEMKDGRLKGRTDIDNNNSEQWRDYRTAGFLMERAFREMLTERQLLKLGEFEVDGIFMTPDYVDANGWVLEEWKCTWRSAGKDIEELDWWSWFAQMKAYCKALGTLKARLRVFYVNGTYSPRKPKLSAWDIEFTQDEVDSNWSMLVNYAKHEGWI